MATKTQQVSDAVLISMASVVTSNASSGEAYIPETATDAQVKKASDYVSNLYLRIYNYLKTKYTV